MPTCTVDNKFKLSQNSNYCEKYRFERRCHYKPENWEKDQEYEGEFFSDSIHGTGAYTWNNSGIYEGDFYSSCKEGYAVLSLPNNSYFEGLFIKNQPFGPGILTHGDGSQDAGFWVGQKLVRLSRSVDFIVPRLALKSAQKKSKQFQQDIPLNEENVDSTTEITEKYAYLFEHVGTPYSKLIYDPRSCFFDKILFENAYFKNANNLLSNFKGIYIEPEEDEQQYDLKSEEDEADSDRLPPAHCLCTDEVFVMKYTKKDEESTEDICLEENILTKEKGYMGSYYNRDNLEGAPDEVIIKKSADSNLERSNEVDEKKQKPFPAGILSLNKSELCAEMLKQIFRFQPFEESFKIRKLILGRRQKARRPGVKEKQCLNFLEKCALGPPHSVKEFLCSNELSEQLMDARGNTGLMFAAATDQHDIIDLLLDYGVDVNTSNDESLTPLNLCLLRRLAQSYKVYSWETAFLPPQTVKTLNEVEEKDSDQYLNQTLENRRSSILKKSSAGKPSGKVQSFTTDEDRTLSTLSDITVFKVKKELERDSKQEVRSTVTGQKPLASKLETNIAQKDSRLNGLGPKDRYLFELSPNPTSQVDQNQKEPGKKNNSAQEVNEQEEDDKSLTDTIVEIDKTIEKLLQRGADPNLSDEPRPSVHLALFTKDPKTVKNLLVHGANPNVQLHLNDGLLTPLHVVALLKPSAEYVDICQTLLAFKANPEKETSPEYSTYEEEKSMLDYSRGRTPLHLLCMRPDSESVDPQGFLIEIGVMIAKASDKNNFYNGHSYLTLAMLGGNVNLLRALLESKYFNPNVTLGKDLGTALHVLVSTLLQMRTNYDKSLEMCDLLIAAGADPLKTFKAPEHLMGTCVDYGYREIEREKMKRKTDDAGKKTKGKSSKLGKKEEKRSKSEKKEEKSSKFGKKEKKSSKLEKKEERDPLKDHIRVVEYLNKKALEIIAKKSAQKRSYKTKKEEEKINKKKNLSSKIDKEIQELETTPRKRKHFKITVSEEKSRRGKHVKRAKSEETPRKGKHVKQTESEVTPRKGKHVKRTESEEKPKKGKHVKRTESEETPRKGKHVKRAKSEETPRKGKNVKRTESEEKPKKGKHVKRTESEETPRKGKHVKRAKSEETQRKGKHVKRTESEEKPKKGKHVKRTESEEKPKKGKNVKRAESEETPRKSKHVKRAKSEETPRKGKNVKRTESEEKPKKGKHVKRAESEEKPRKGKNVKRAESEEKPRKGKNVKRAESEETPRKRKNVKRTESDTTPRKDKKPTEQSLKKQRENRILKTTGANEQTLSPKSIAKGKKHQKETESSEEMNVLNKQRKNKDKKTFANNEEDPSKKSKGKRVFDETTKGDRIKDSTKHFGREKKEEKLKMPKKHEKSESNENVSERKRDGKNTKYDFLFKEKNKGKMSTITEDSGVGSSKEKEKGRRELGHEIKKTDELFEKPDLPKPLTNIDTEMPVGKLKKFFLQMFGICPNFDINELFLPYVVLRDGDLYYRFQGKATRRKEQYSLV